MTTPHLMNCPHSDSGWCLECVAKQHAEVERLTADYQDGDRDSQAMAWGAVWKTCEKAGLLSFFGSGMRGRDRVCEFITWMRITIDQLTAEAERLRAALNECDVVMETAAMHGLPQQLPPAYRDSWVRVHTAAKAIVDR